MDHDSIRNKLSEYLDGAVTPAEKLLIEKHLAECGDCRKSLLELEKTVQHLRDLGELEPPPWLAVRIMARVREEAGREKGLLRRLLQVPLRWRVSVEAAALVFLCVTGYLVYRNVSSELPQITPLSGVSRKEPAPSAPLPAESRKVPEERTPLPEKPSPGKEEKQSVALPPAPRSLPTEEPFPAVRREEPEMQKPSPEEAPVESEDKGGHEFRMQERNAAKSLSPPTDSLLSEQEGSAPAGMLREKARSSTGVEVLKIEISVAKSDSAVKEIERSTVRYGGVILRRDLRSASGKVLVVRLKRKAVQGYLELLAHFGDVRGAVSAAPEGDNTVEIYLAITGGRE